MSETIVNEKVKTDLSTADFYYDLPKELIAQHPEEKRDASRLMVLDRQKTRWNIGIFMIFWSI